MSHTNTTTNYGLPQFLSSDNPAWMADINVAFSDIDGQMKTNADAASAAQTTADNSVLNGAPGYSNLSTYAVGDVVNYLGRVYKCDIAVTTPEAFDNAKWSYYRLSDASAQLDVIDGEIGSTDISAIGDGSITGAISNVNSELSANIIGSSVVISQAYWTASRDGYIILNSSTLESGHFHVLASDTDGTEITLIRKQITERYQYDSVFVRKGLKIKLGDDSSTGVVVNFRGLLPNN